MLFCMVKGTTRKEDKIVVKTRVCARRFSHGNFVLRDVRTSVRIISKRFKCAIERLAEK